MVVLQTGLGERIISGDVEGKAFDSLPVISLARLTSPNLDDRKALAAEVGRACIDAGFFYISEHGIEEETIEAAFGCVSSFLQGDDDDEGS